MDQHLANPPQFNYSPNQPISTNYSRLLFSYFRDKETFV